MPFASARHRPSRIEDSTFFLLHLRSEVFLTALTAARNNRHHAICTLRAHRIREPPPSPDQWLGDCISGEDSLIPRHTIHQCLLLRWRRVLRAMLIT